MKKFVGLLLTICLLGSFYVPAFAADAETVSETILEEIVQEEIMDIPVFVILTDGIELTEEKKEEATTSVANYCDVW